MVQGEKVPISENLLQLFRCSIQNFFCAIGKFADMFKFNSNSEPLGFSFIITKYGHNCFSYIVCFARGDYQPSEFRWGLFIQWKHTLKSIGCQFSTKCYFSWKFLPSENTNNFQGNIDKSPLLLNKFPQVYRIE